MENNSIQNLIKQWFDDDPGLFTEGLENNEIKNMQALLGVSFSRQYISFLKEYGSGIVDSFYIYGSYADDFMDGPLESVVENTLFYKETQKWPGIEDWYIISDDGRGNPIGCKPDGSVWLSDHDAGFEQVKLADDFEQFLGKLLTDTLYEG